LQEPFSTTGVAGKGPSLGLAIAHGIVKQHRGAITAEDLPGQGPTITVLLPLLDAEARRPGADGKQVSQTGV
jgi:signal transduction histidine kinase